MSTASDTLNELSSNASVTWNLQRHRINHIWKYRVVHNETTKHHPKRPTYFDHPSSHPVESKRNALNFTKQIVCNLSVIVEQTCRLFYRRTQLSRNYPAMCRRIMFSYSLHSDSDLGCVQVSFLYPRSFHVVLILSTKFADCGALSARKSLFGIVISIDKFLHFGRDLTHDFVNA